MECRYCKKDCLKAGKNSNGKQKFYSRYCNKYQQDKFVYKAYDIKVNEHIIQYVKNSCGIRSIGRLLGISNTTVIKRIRQIGSSLTSTYESEKGAIYEMDEMRTFVGNKKQDQWLIYAINKGTRRVVDLKIGKRTKETIQKVVDKVLKFQPRRIYTDGLNIYPGLINFSVVGASLLFPNLRSNPGCVLPKSADLPKSVRYIFIF